MLARRIDGLDALLGDGGLREVDQHQRHGAIALATCVGEHDREGRLPRRRPPAPSCR
jgi:hypothetical protein